MGRFDIAKLAKHYEITSRKVNVWRLISKMINRNYKTLKIIDECDLRMFKQLLIF